MLIRFNMLFNLLVPDAPLKLLLQIIIMKSNGVLLVIPWSPLNSSVFFGGGGVTRCLGPR